jgi:hypothetical protein
MKKWTRLVAIGFAALSAMSYVNTASAQATRTWVSGVGDDANPCSRTAPCKTFAGAISKTAAAGEINCIDPGSFGSVTITKSMTISCEDVEAGILNSGTNGVTVNAGANDIVVLRGLDFDSSPSTPGLNGIRFLAGAALYVEDSVIRDNKTDAAGSGFGIHFAPSTGMSRLHVSNSWITSNGSGTNGAGIQIAPTGSGSAQALIENTYVVNNIVGIRGDSNSTSGRVDISISDSSVSGASFHGIVALGADRPVRIVMKNVVSSSNEGDGIRAVQANALIRMGGSIVSGNGAGVATGLGGAVESYGTNQIDGNTVAGVTPTLIGAN